MLQTSGCSRPGENKELALEQFTRYEIQRDQKAENTETSDSFSTVAQKVDTSPTVTRERKSVNSSRIADMAGR